MQRLTLFTGSLALVVALVAPRPDEARASEGLVCEQGQFSPPDAMFDYEIGFASRTDPNPQSAAEMSAREKLAARLCGSSVPCEEVRRLMKLEQVGRSGERVCAMVTVNRYKLADVIANVGSIEPLDHGLAEVAKVLRAEVSRVLPALRAPKVAIGTVSDGGGSETAMVGGERARWLAARVSLALREAGFVVVTPKRNNLGEIIGRGYDVLVEAASCERIEKGSAIFEVSLTGHLADGMRIDLRPAYCGVTALQKEGVSRPSTAEGLRRAGFTDEGLHFEIPTGPGGVICEGDRSQLYLTTDRDLEVRVFDLYGDGEGLVIFPNEWMRSGRVKARTRVPLGGPDGFDVVLTPGAEHERYLVIAADSVEALGAWGRMRGTCRLSADAARMLRDGERADFPRGVRLGETGFRVVRSGCSHPPPSAEQKQKLLKELATIRECL